MLKKSNITRISSNIVVNLKKILKQKKSQSAIEFLIIFIAAFFFLVSILFVINENLTQKQIEKEAKFVKEIALTVQKEISLAQKSSDGYLRNFYIPKTINGRDYNINITDNYIYVKTNKNSISLSITPIQGNIQKGLNTIRKQEGVVYLNQ